MRVGGTVQNILKGGWNRKEGGSHKNFKKVCVCVCVCVCVGVSWVKGGCLKKRGWKLSADIVTRY